MKAIIKNKLKEYEIIVILFDFLKEFYHKWLLSDERLIKRKFKERQGIDVELEHPLNFSDKLQWLKLNWYDPLAIKCADKYEARQIVKEIIGKDHLNNLIGVYEDVKEIDIDKLPEKFVLKGTHGSGYNIICRDKSEMDWDKEFKKMKRWLRTNYYYQFREWVYKDIKPRIICEKFLHDENNDPSLIDYKFYCFNGKPVYCQVIRDRGENETIDFYDNEWNHMPFTGLRPLPMSKKEHEKPLKYEEMLDLAEKLAFDFPFVRVDFYYVQNQIYFGELTFFPVSGLGKFTPDEWNRKIGDLLKLPTN